jgi:hypothetical protein
MKFIYSYHDFNLKPRRAVLNETTLEENEYNLTPASISMAKDLKVGENCICFTNGDFHFAGVIVRTE